MDLEKYMFPCLSKTLFGIECLGCGFQRSFILFLHGDFIASFKMYPALITTFLFLGIIAFSIIQKNKKSNNLIFASAVLNGVFMIAGYIYKNY